MAPADWRSDPSGRHELRYWDGVQWTDHISDQGQVGVDAYDSADLPPPPPTAPMQPATPASVSYLLVCYDRKDNEIYSAPFQSADMAMQFANNNQSFELKHSLGSMLLKGGINKNIVRWRTATIFRVDDVTGDATEYHTFHQGR